VAEEDIADILVADIENIVGIAEVDIVDKLVEEVEDIPGMHDTVADIVDREAEEDIVGKDFPADSAADTGALLQQGMVDIVLEDIVVLEMNSNSEAKEVPEVELKHLKTQKCLECYSFADLSCKSHLSVPSFVDYFDRLILEAGLTLIQPFL